MSSIYKEASEYIEELYNENEALKNRVSELENKSDKVERNSRVGKIASTFSLDQDEASKLQDYDDSAIKVLENFTGISSDQSFGKVEKVAQDLGNNELDSAREDVYNFLARN